MDPITETRIFYIHYDFENPYLRNTDIRVTIKVKEKIRLKIKRNENTPSLFLYEYIFLLLIFRLHRFTTKYLV